MPEFDSIRIIDFDYTLPAEKIAQVPLETRDSSKLLVYKEGEIRNDTFSNIDQYLPGNSLLVFNNTRVIRARLKFRKSTGAQIEIFCLEPVTPSCELTAAFQQRETASWKCLVGNMKRWRSGPIMLKCRNGEYVSQLTAICLQDYGDGCYEIAFHWEPAELTFSEILELAGQVPLPPYINRSADSTDNERYQTIYAQHEGSVAAPTAGLHFTTPLLSRLRTQGIETEHVTLHVGMGTFKPVSADHIRDHVMHEEKIVVTKRSIESLLANLHRPLFAVGTTSARTLESIYWLGVQIIREGVHIHPGVSQWYPYQQQGTCSITPLESLEALNRYLSVHHLDEYSGETRLMVVPGYQYNLLSGLITNFHMPQSTLLLLVAAMIGNDWKKVYQYAQNHDYRFLSYGDSCLFFKQQK